MSTRLSESVSKIQINIFTTDVEFLKLHLGHGWSGLVRELIREYVTELRTEIKSEKKK